MYAEAALPLVLVVPLVVRPRAPGGRVPRWRWIPSVALACLLVTAVVLSATRTGLVTAALVLGAVLVLGWRVDAPVRQAAGGALLVLALAVPTAHFAGEHNSRLAQRLLWWQDASWFRADYTLAERRLLMPAGGVRQVAVSVRNAGTLTWPHAGRDAVALSYHWQSADAGAPRLHFDGLRTRLPADVAPGGEVRVLGVVQAPAKPGAYRLRWDLVRENVTWFSMRGNPTADQDVVVQPAAGIRTPARDAAHNFVAMTLEQTLGPVNPSRLVLWSAGLRLWRQHPLLGVGPDNYRHLYSGVLPPPPAGRDSFEDDRVHANSFYVETLADMGLLGLGALALLIAALAGTARGRLRAGEPRLLVVAWTAAAGAFFVHGALDYFLEFTPTYGLYWLTLALTGGAWSAPAATPEPPDSTASAPPR
jgi:hypothetical protein